MLKGDELITYGFKKVVELLEKIENNTYVASKTLLEIEGRLARIENAVTVTETAALEIQRNTKGRKNGGQGQQI